MGSSIQAFSSRFASSLCCLMIVLCVAAGGVLAAQPAGELILTRGVVKLRHDHQDHIYKTPGQHVPVFAGDHVQTARGTHVQIVLPDGRGVISIYSSTALVVLGESGKQTVLGLMVGKAAFAIDPKDASAGSSVRTPMASINAEGARFVAEHSGTQTALLTEEGSVAFSSRSYPDVRVTVAKGQVSRVVPMQPPSEPVVASANVQQRITSEDDQDTLKTLDFGAPAAVTTPAPAGPPDELPAGGGPPSSVPGAGSPGSNGPPSNVPPGNGPPSSVPPGHGPPSVVPPRVGPPDGVPGNGPPDGAPPRGGLPVGGPPNGVPPGPPNGVPPGPPNGVPPGPPGVVPPPHSGPTWPPGAVPPHGERHGRHGGHGGHR